MWDRYLNGCSIADMILMRKGYRAEIYGQQVHQEVTPQWVAIAW